MSNELALLGVKDEDDEQVVEDQTEGPDAIDEDVQFEPSLLMPADGDEQPANHLDTAIDEQKKLVGEAALEAAELTARAKSAKKRFDGEVEELQRLVDDKQRRDNPEPTPFFDADGQATPDAEDESWREVLLVNLRDPGIPAKLLTALEDHEPSITTMGDLYGWQTAHIGAWAKDIKGLGEVAVAAVERATLAFWEQRNQDKAEEADD